MTGDSSMKLPLDENLSFRLARALSSAFEDPDLGSRDDKLDWTRISEPRAIETAGDVKRPA